MDVLLDPGLGGSSPHHLLDIAPRDSSPRKSYAEIRWQVRLKGPQELTRRPRGKRCGGSQVLPGNKKRRGEGPTLRKPRNRSVGGGDRIRTDSLPRARRALSRLELHPQCLGQIAGDYSVLWRSGNRKLSPATDRRSSTRATRC